MSIAWTVAGVVVLLLGLIAMIPLADFCGWLMDRNWRRFTPVVYLIVIAHALTLTASLMLIAAAAKDKL